MCGKAAEKVVGPYKPLWTGQTQWAGQFGVGHELVRRGYMVAFTLGNAPGVDLMCQSPSKVLFIVEVKSARTKAPFLYQKVLREKSDGNRFFVFVFLPQDPKERPEYYVLTNKEFQETAAQQEALDAEAVKKRGKPYAESWKTPGISYKVLAAHNFRDAWPSLPK